MGRLCYPTQHPATVLVPRGSGVAKLSRCKEGMARVFAVQVQILPKCWRDRGTRLIGTTSLSPVTKLVAGTGAASRWKLSRSQKFITTQDLNCEQMRVSGCKNHYKFVLGAGAKAKTVTNNLPILSVLGLDLLFC